MRQWQPLDNAQQEYSGWVLLRKNYSPNMIVSSLSSRQLQVYTSSELPKGVPGDEEARMGKILLNQN